MGQSERATEGASQRVSEMLDRVDASLREIDELEPRLAESASDDVAMSLLERATELAEEAGRRLEHLGDVGA